MKFILCIMMWVASSLLAYAQPIETVTAQNEQSEKIMLLTKKVNELESKLSSLSYDTEKLEEEFNRSALAVLFFAFFSAWWAKSTGRSALLWFVLGIFFNFITAIVIVCKTERGIKK